MKLEEILNILFQNQVNLVICGDFNVNFRTDSTKNIKLHPSYVRTI
jgi:exonuclease III